MRGEADASIPGWIPAPGGRVGVGGLLVDPGQGAGTLVCSRVVTDKVHVLEVLGAASSPSTSLEPQVGGHWPQGG